jgi:hypothetical protein
LQVVDYICQEISAVTNRSVESGMSPMNLLSQTVVTLAANSEPARDVLLRVFASLHYKGLMASKIPQLSWQLFYAPDVKMYVLSIHVVQMEKPAPFGGVIIQKVDR